ncbi:MAG: hypothetical protein ACHQJ5_03955 [Vicinamibacteria bacterium]
MRYVSTGGLGVDKTQPFGLDRQVFAHNGQIEDLVALEERVGDYRDRINGETESEGFLARSAAKSPPGAPPAAASERESPEARQ